MKRAIFAKVLLSLILSFVVVLLLPKGAADYTLGQEAKTSIEGEILGEAATTQGFDQESFEKIIPT